MLQRRLCLLLVPLLFGLGVSHICIHPVGSDENNFKDGNVVVSQTGNYCFSKDNEYITPSDERILEALRSERAVSVRGIGEGKGQPSTLIFGLASGLQMKCKNGRAAYYKMEQTVNEVFSFYLDRLLRGGHVPPSVITSFSGSRWKDVRDDALVTKNWKKGDPLVCSQWVSDLTPAKFPTHLKRETVQLNVPRALEKNWSQEERTVTEMWGYVATVDYLTGNSERLANSLASNADVWKAPKDRRKQGIIWSGCRKDTCEIDNAWVTPNGQLALVDNNSAFFYDKNMIEPLPWIFEDTCIFPSQLVSELSKRDASGARSALYDLISHYEPEGALPSYVRGNYFAHFYRSVMQHLERCKQQYGKLSFD